ncbi:MAG: AroM family protein [Alphaproteobacteria bacterium]|nr:AroM family protein [Alphaproteobacteria bacterium]
MTEALRARPVLGAIVVGQSPRPDVHRLLQEAVGDGTRVELVGSLDGLSRAEVEALKPADGGDTLFTKLPDGSGVQISKKVVAGRAQRLVDRFAADGARATVICCTGAFPTLVPKGVVVFPSAVLAGLAQGLLPAGRLGLFVPLPRQAQALAAKWGRPGVAVVAEPLLPLADAREATAAADRMAAHAPDLVVMDCISYTVAQRDAVRARIAAPVLLAVSVTAAVLGEMFA